MLWTSMCLRRSPSASTFINHRDSSQVWSQYSSIRGACFDKKSSPSIRSLRSEARRFTPNRGGDDGTRTVTGENRRPTRRAKPSAMLLSRRPNPLLHCFIELRVPHTRATPRVCLDVLHPMHEPGLQSSSCQKIQLPARLKYLFGIPLPPRTNNAETLSLLRPNL